MEETASITYHSSLALSQNRFTFLPFQRRFIFLFTAVRVIFCHSCHRTRSSERTLSVCSPVLSGFASALVRGGSFHDPQCNANVRVRVQARSPSGALGAIGAKKCHIIIQKHCLSGLTPLILWRLHKLLTVKLSTHSLPRLCLFRSLSLLIDLI